MSTKANESQAGAVNAVDQPAKGIGCKLPAETYQGIATGLIAGRTVADLAVQGSRSNLSYPRNSKGGSEETGWGAIYPLKSGGGGGSRTPVPAEPIQDVYMLSQGWIVGSRITA